MNLTSAIQINAGGPGSGCNGPNCGRPRLEGIRPGSATAMLPRGGKAHRAFEILKDGLPHNPAALKRQMGVGAITRVLRQLADHVSKYGYKIEYRRGMVIMTQQPGANKGVPPAGQAVQKKNDSASEDALRNAKVSSTKRLGGGVNHTEVLTFTDGSKAVWKPGEDGGAGRKNITSGFNIEREVGAWKVAELVGMQDMVPVVIDTEVKGERGAMLAWQEGNTAADKNNPWAGPKYDGQAERTKAAAFDYVIGNEDRHGFNWLIKPDGKIGLIDHGLAFPDKGKYFAANQKFLDKARSDESMGRNIATPKDLAAPYMAAHAEIVDTLKRVGLPQTAINGVTDRIWAMNKATKWDDLPGVRDYP